MPRTTSIKNRFYISPTNLVVLSSHFPWFLSVKTITNLNLGQGETLEIEIEKLAVVVHVLRTTLRLLISCCCFAEDGKEMYKDL